MSSFKKCFFFFEEVIHPFYFYLGDGEYEAAEIDKELISARLKQDVLDNSGKIHLFVADSVRGIYAIPFLFRPTF